MRKVSSREVDHPMNDDFEVWLNDIRCQLTERLAKGMRPGDKALAEYLAWCEVTGERS
jgi:hypothetical protein